MTLKIARVAASIAAALLFFVPCAAAEQVPQWELGAGIVGFLLPDYRGSDEVRGYVLPYPYIVYRLEWLKADRTGIQSRLFRSERAEVNASLNATPPVRSKNNRAREGMSNLSPMVEFGPSLALHLWRAEDRRMLVDVRVPVRGALTIASRPRDAGVTVSPTLNLDVAEIGGKPWNLGLVAGPIFATRRQNSYFYGVSEADARPDRPAYQAHGGYAGTQFLVAVSRRFETAWFGAYARYDTLHGAVFEDSPLVRRRYYLSGGVSIAWVPLKSSKMVGRNNN